MKQKLIIYGAFDRYNYGDNLMPLLTIEYIKEFNPSLNEKFDIILSSITSSNLSEYACAETIGINKINTKDSTIIVVGGEVIGARKETLFAHNIKSQIAYSIILRLKYRFPRLYRGLVNLVQNEISNFPYIVERNGNETILYNTVGGTVPSDVKERERILSALGDAKFISVRDQRTLFELKNFKHCRLAPDSVQIAAHFFSDNSKLYPLISATVKDLENSTYIIFQASPFKLSESDATEALVEAIKKVYSKTEIRVLLLPIGYATGHDDLDLLKTVNNKIPELTELVYPLNVWEIMFCIKHSQCFYGTSLHGMITALSFGVPHYNINQNIRKVSAYLQDWSLPPFTAAVKLREIETTVDTWSKRPELIEQGKILAELVIKNYKKMFSNI